jgi:hypothetical protein
LVGRELVEATMPQMPLESEIAGLAEPVSRLRRGDLRAICYRMGYRVAQILLAQALAKTQQ